MASPKNTPGAGHNGPPLTADERVALGVHHQLKISEAQRKLDALLVDVSAQRKLVNGNFKRMTADLGFARQRFQSEVLDKLSMTDAEYQAYVAETAELHTIASLKTGEQIDLIEHVLKDTADETEATKAHGFRTGRAAADPTPPDFISPILHPVWMEAWHDGQAYNAAMLLKAADVLARPKPGTMVAGDDPDAAEDEDDGAPEELDPQAEADKLKAAGWTGPTPEEQAFEEADGGKTIRAPGRGRRRQEAALA